MSGKILVLTALDDELKKARAPENVEVIYTGLGKVNAASAATLSLLVLRPSLVINFGTAGGLNPLVQGLVEVSRVVQRDMLAMPLAARGRTPYSPEFDHFSSGREGVTCGTGDSFVTESDPWMTEQGIDVVDMELFAIAHVCVRHSIPWRAFKFISDQADEGAYEKWQANIASGEDLFWAKLGEISAG